MWGLLELTLIDKGHSLRDCYNFQSCCTAVLNSVQQFLCSPCSTPMLNNLCSTVLTVWNRAFYFCLFFFFVSVYHLSSCWNRVITLVISEETFLMCLHFCHKLLGHVRSSSGTIIKYRVKTALLAYVNKDGEMTQRVRRRCKPDPFCFRKIWTSTRSVPGEPLS